MCMLGVVSTSDHVSKYCKDMGCIACMCVEGRIEKFRSVTRAKVSGVARKCKGKLGMVV